MSSVARAVRSLLPVLLAALLPHAALAQQTLHVPADYPTVQAAIDAANSGDTVSVSAGTYYENLTIQAKTISLVAAAPSSQTTLDGSGLGPVLTIANTPGPNATTVLGFTVQHGAPAPGSSQAIPTPSGIVVSNAGALLSGNVLANNTGGGIAILNASAIVQNNTVGTATTAGGACSGTSTSAAPGIYLQGASTVLNSLGTVQPTLLVGNTIFGDGTRCSGDGVQIDNLGQPLTLQNNTIRNNLLGVSGEGTNLFFVQNLIYDNVSGGLFLTAASNAPNVDPPTTFLINNTVVNNLTSPAPDAAGDPITDIYLAGTVARTAFLNNILVGTTTHPVLTCATATPSLNDTPLLLDHNDLYNTTQTPGALISGACTTSLGASPTSQIGVNGNLSIDPRLTGSTDLHPLPGSPVLDAGNNSAPFHVSQDLDGNPRVADATGVGYPIIDLGAYEHTGTALVPQTATRLTASSYFTPGGPVTLTAVLHASDGTSPLTSVTFLENGSPVGTATTDATGTATLAVPLTAYGVYALTASSAAPSGYAPSVSPVLYIDVTSTATPATTTLTLTGSNTSPYLNQGFTLTAHLGSLVPGSQTQAGPVPPGSLTLYDGATFLANLQPDSSGVASFTIAGASSGQHSYVVSYAGTPSYTPATATLAVGVVTPVATATNATVAPSPAALGQAVTLSAAVSALSGTATPTGSVSFADGTTSLGTVPLAGGAASLTTTSLSVGLHTITFAYTPDPAFSPSSAAGSVNVGGVATATTLGSSQNPAFPGNAVVFTITVANADGTPHNGPPSGSVRLSDGATLIASGALSATSAAASSVTLSATFTTLGAHPLSATFVPATSADVSSSASLSQTITALPAVTTALTATPNPVTLGQSVTLTATASSAAPLALPATVTFLDGAAPLGTATLSSSGVATQSLSTLSPGTHTLSAVVHTADATGVRSTSNTVSLQVNLLASSLSLSAAPSPSTLAGSLVTLTATLTPGGTPTAAPTGSVTFFDGAAVLGLALLSPAGNATLTTSALATGTHSLTATYSGDSLTAGATSPAVTEQVTANPTAITLALSTPATTAFQSVSLAAHVAPVTATAASIATVVCSPACVPPVVTFYASTGGGSPVPVASVAVNASGNAVAQVAPPAGTVSLYAAFSGDPLFAASTSASSTLSVAQAPSTLSLTASPNPISLNNTATLTAVVSTATLPGLAPGGLVTFSEGTNVLGTAPLAGSASLAWTGTTAGTHTLTATWPGTANDLAATANLTVTVLPAPVVVTPTADFTLTTSAPSMTLRTEHHGNLGITLTPSGSFFDTVHLSCGNLPEFVSCTFASTDPAVGTTASPATVSVAIDTDFLLDWVSRVETGPSARGSHGPGTASPRPGSPSGRTAVTLTLAAPFALLGTCLLRRRGRRSTSRSASRSRLPDLLALLLVSAAALSLTACSGKQPGHTPPGTYTFTVTAHGNTTAVEHSTTMTLVVTP